mmetsp:Transcript_3672/g.7408  ORF Transcript_3672/g.7408 Transcript_3672/m.7408 type:complete len:643 (+) Transcript_3672:1091-3019(+)|eukprot:CAMPEP_0118644420 /NCGR_PEP_ID=MMETSP0785-20121206/6936_1 /TAXON_ID=91992 /ORGANISM="Bolidomonas pacifica, Strain CCMP 1866" /LENGTH=642 /DNA_ID=CAMNT_0006536191 /DNA_START=75 /DNA_END=2003 /DNA_ORIENTATION=-
MSGLKPPRNGRLVAVIPVRGGSTRCPGKNSRPFGSETLLERKIKLLRTVSGIDDVVVSSDCPQMLQLAKNLGARIHEREDQAKLHSSSTAGSDLFHLLGSSAAPDADYIMYATCVSPFLKKETIEDMINIFRTQPNKYDSVASVKSTKEFFFIDGHALNFNPEAQSNSQGVTPIQNLTFGACIIERENMVKLRNCVGKTPHFYEVDELESIDIDTPLEYIISEHLFTAGINTGEDVADYLQYLKQKKTRQRPLFLDCTIRDGGYTNNWNFSNNFVAKAYAAVSAAGMEYFEIGFRTNVEMFPPHSKLGKWAYVDDSLCKQIIRDSGVTTGGAKIAVMAKMGTFSSEDFTDATDSPVDMVRVLFPLYNEEKKSKFSEKLFATCVQMCREIKAKGYTVCLNLACADVLTMEEYEKICDLVVYSKAKMSSHDGVSSSPGMFSPGIPCCDFLYLADTYGAVDADLAARLVKKLRFELAIKHKCISCQIGFHGHNNLGDGWTKTLAAIDSGAAIVDSCILGLGRGAGNVQSEVLLCHAKNMEDAIPGRRKLDIEPLLYFGDSFIQAFDHLPFCSRFTYGTNSLHLMTGCLKMHPDYAQTIINNFRGMSLTRAIAMLKIIAKCCHESDTNNFSINTFNSALEKTKGVE